MKPILIRTASTLMLTLLLSSVLSYAAGAATVNKQDRVTIVSAAELTSVTGGCRKNCGSGGRPGDTKSQVGTTWRQINQVNGPLEQVSYSIVREFSNVQGMNPKSYEYPTDDGCRHVWTSGGIGITTGFSVNVGTVYHCPKPAVVSGSMDPGWRVKIYRGDMRQVITVTVAEFAVFSDGSHERTGRTDVGRREDRWYRYSAVDVQGN